MPLHPKIYKGLGLLLRKELLQFKLNFSEVGLWKSSLNTFKNGFTQLKLLQSILDMGYGLFNKRLAASLKT